MQNDSIVFGPVPSCRLGRSLGINNILPKICSYSCVYCQLSRTLDMRVKRQAFYDPDELVRTVRRRVEELRAAGEGLDYLTFVPDEEPTLDAHLGEEIAALKAPGIPIAVISNASLIAREDVQEDLSRADWVSLKMTRSGRLPRNGRTGPTRVFPSRRSAMKSSSSPTSSAAPWPRRPCSSPGLTMPPRRSPRWPDSSQR